MVLKVEHLDTELRLEDLWSYCGFANFDFWTRHDTSDCVSERGRGWLNSIAAATIAS